MLRWWPCSIEDSAVVVVGVVIIIINKLWRMTGPLTSNGIFFGISSRTLQARLYAATSSVSSRSCEMLMGIDRSFDPRLPLQQWLPERCKEVAKRDRAASRNSRAAVSFGWLLRMRASVIKLHQKTSLALRGCFLAEKKETTRIFSGVRVKYLMS